MAFRYEIRLSGSGGQGLILAGIILAEAAGIYDGRFVVQTQSYGPEARGGVSKSEIVISDEEIDYPKAIKLDLLLAMNQGSCDEYFKDLKEGGLLAIDSTIVTSIPAKGAFRIPFTQIAQKELGKKFVANMVALGAISQITDIISTKGIEAAIIARVPKGTESLNIGAFKAGIEAARNIIRDLPNK